jgi:hypothetical protein
MTVWRDGERQRNGAEVAGIARAAKQFDGFTRATYGTSVVFRKVRLASLASRIQLIDAKVRVRAT